MEKETSTSGYTALLQASEEDSLFHKIDHALSIKSISAELEKLTSNNLPKLVCIEGVSGSGKTILARVLAATGRNAKYIDVREEYSCNNYNKVDVSAHTKSGSTAYIIDEAACCTSESLVLFLSHHLEAGGVAVLLCQNSRDLDLPMKGSWFSLSKNILTKHGGAGCE